MQHDLAQPPDAIVGRTRAGTGQAADRGARPARRWWETPWAVWAAALLAAVPLLWPAIPPLIDLPGHIGAYRVATALHDSAALQRYYGFDWALIGNLGVDLAIVPLTPLVGVEMATKLVVLCIPMLTVAGMLWVSREAHGRVAPSAWFALPLAYSYAWQFGFANYCLSVAFMLLGFALWLRLGTAGRIGARAALFCAIAPVVWITHAMGWAMLCVVCAVAELQRRRAAGQGVAQTLVRGAASCLALGSPLLLMAAAPHHAASHASGFLDTYAMQTWLLSLLRDRWAAFDLASTALLAGLLLAAALRLGGLRLSPTLLLPAGALVLMFLLAPVSIDDSYHVKGRIAPVAVALLLLAVSPERLSEAARRRLALAGGLFFAARIIGATASYALYGAAFDAELQAIAHIAPGSAVLSLTPRPLAVQAAWRESRLQHLSGLALARKDAFVNSEWAIDGLQLLKVHYAAAGAYRADPSETVNPSAPADAPGSLAAGLATFPRAAFDYLWLIDVPRAAWPQDPDFRLIWSNTHSALYRIRHP